jgi:hypothetical protein
VTERPGATAAEIAGAADLAQSTLARLARQGALERYAPPGGGTGYRPLQPTPAADRARASRPARPAAAAREVGSDAD